MFQMMLFSGPSIPSPFAHCPATYPEKMPEFLLAFSLSSAMLLLPCPHDELKILIRELDAWTGLEAKAALWWRDDDAAEPCVELDRLFRLSAERGVPCGLATVPAKAGEAPAQGHLGAKRHLGAPARLGARTTTPVTAREPGNSARTVPSP